MPLLIVESPAKARKIGKMLGHGWSVRACCGHIWKLADHLGELPEHHRALPWAPLAVNPEGDYDTLYVPQDPNVIRELGSAIRQAKGDVYLATDPDREGEAIAWHLAQQFALPSPRRVTYQEITKPAVLAAIERPRAIDLDLVAAQDARRVLDRLAGYVGSPLVWEALGNRRLSVGRVQSAALLLLAQREQARLAFKTSSFVRLSAPVQGAPGAPAFTAHVTHLRGAALATGASFAASGEVRSDLTVYRPTRAQAQALASTLSDQAATVTAYEVTPIRRRPPPPLTTSTLQQAAGRQLGLSAEQITGLAQDLYEAGWITYVRTNSPTLSDEAVALARAVIEDEYPQALPGEARRYGTRHASAQEAHEAIRPAGKFLAPEQTDLTGDARQLYALIYHRTLASQMADAQGLKQTVTLHCAEATLSASGSRLTEAGFTAVYDDQDPEDGAWPLPELAPGQVLTLGTVKVEEQKSRAPQRYAEGSFIAVMEKAGIGRPSTYAATLRTLRERGFIQLRAGAIHVTPLGLSLAMYLLRQLPELVDVKFTAQMEERLDAIARGELTRRSYLDQIWKGVLAPAIARAERTPPRTRLLHLDGAALEFEGARLVLSVRGERLALPEGILPEDLTPRAVEQLRQGQWKPPRAARRKPRAAD